MPQAIPIHVQRLMESLRYGFATYGNVGFEPAVICYGPAGEVTVAYPLDGLPLNQHRGLLISLAKQHSALTYVSLAVSAIVGLPELAGQSPGRRGEILRRFMCDQENISRAISAPEVKQRFMLLIQHCTPNGDWHIHAPLNEDKSLAEWDVTPPGSRAVGGPFAHIYAQAKPETMN